MPDLRQQVRDYYDAQSLSPEQVKAILERGGAATGGAETAPVAERKIVRFSRGWKVGLSLAAAGALFAGLAAGWRRAPQPVSYAALAPRVVEFFGQPPALPKRSQNPDELRAWLIAQGAPRDFQIPAKLQGLASLGCEVMDVKGKPAYLACFWREKESGVGKGELVHLLVARRADFREGPATATPQFREIDGWSFASWMAGEVIYTMAAAAPLETLRPFVKASARGPLLLAQW